MNNHRGLTNQHGDTVECEQVDESAALSALDGERELLRQLASMFVEDAPVLLRNLQAGLSTQDPLAARHAVHSLKGLAATFFATPTVELAQRLENELSAGRMAAVTDGGAEQLRQTTEALCKELYRRGWVECQ